MKFIKKTIFLTLLAATVVMALFLLLFPSTSSRITAPVAVDENNFTFAVIGDTQRFNAGRKNGGLQKAIRAIGRKK